MTQMTKIRLSTLVLALTLSMAAAPLPAQLRGHAADDNAPAIGGYSPLSYFEAGRPERGSPAHTSHYRGKTYWLTNAEQLERFETDPGAYAPVFPDHCPYHLSLGRAVAIDPTNYKILGGKLLLFHDKEEMASVMGSLDRLDSDEIEAMLERARANLLRMQF